MQSDKRIRIFDSSLGLVVAEADSHRSRHVLWMRPQEPEQRQGEMSDSALLRSWQMRQKGDDELEVFVVVEWVNLDSGAARTERILLEMRLTSNELGTWQSGRAMGTL